MPVPYDARRFRTLADIVIPAGTLVIPTPHGTGHAMDPEGSIQAIVLDLAEAEGQGMVRQLADGEA